MENTENTVPKIKGAEGFNSEENKHSENFNEDNTDNTQQIETQNSQEKESFDKSDGDEINQEVKEDKPKIYVIKVTTNKEDNAFDMIADRVKKKDLGVYSLARPHGLRGYLFLESPDRENAEEAVFNLPYVKGILPKLLDYEDIKAMMEPITADVKIEKNDIVEMIAEPFKKEKAKVIRVDKAKGEVVVSLLGSVVPIPTTVKIDNVRVIRREDEELEDIS